MEAAVSPSVDFASTGVRREFRGKAHAVHHPVADVEVVRDLRLVTCDDVSESFAERVNLVPRERSELVSRALNVTVAAFALLVLSPLIALIALAIKLTSAGPVLYKQTRVGLDRRFRETKKYDRRGYDHGGRLFEMYKFRTMRTDAEPDGRAVWAQRRDPRVTAVGRVLRAIRIDEIPQLYNVIRGEMNVVGPRPERPAIFAELREHIPEYHVRQRVKPGITGWAQINQSYDACVDDVRRKVEYDLEYLKRQSVAEDLRIMSMTLPVMLMGRGGW